jgi:hypothetical protein
MLATIVVLLFVIPIFIPIETKIFVIIDTQSPPVCAGYIRTNEGTVRYSILGAEVMKSSAISEIKIEDLKLSYRPENKRILLERAIEMYETEGITETFEVQTSNVLAIILKIIYDFTAPFCWLMMFLVMKKKEA